MICTLVPILSVREQAASLPRERLIVDPVFSAFGLSVFSVPYPQVIDATPNKIPIEVKICPARASKRSAMMEDLGSRCALQQRLVVLSVTMIFGLRRTARVLALPYALY